MCSCGHVYVSARVCKVHHKQTKMVNKNAKKGK